MKLDAHQHFWNYSSERDTWITEEMQVLRRNFTPVELQKILENNEMKGCIAVQADQSETETQYLLDLSDEFDFIKGVVGWVDLLNPKVSDQLEIFSAHRKFKGIRHIVQAEKAGFMDSRDFRNGIEQLESYGLTYDILIYPRQLEEAYRLAKAFPSQPFVIDHLAKPEIRSGNIPEWEEGMKKMASLDNVYCKVSGLVTEATSHWKYEDFVPYLNVVTESFGVSRLMFGSDWPVCLLSATYSEVKNIIEKYYSTFNAADYSKIFGGNAMRFYNLDL